MARILVVDDDASLRMLYERELSAMGHEVIAVGSGKEALAQVDVCPPDLVILDIRMDEMDGLTVLDEIMKRDKTIPVILNTAYSTFKSDFATWNAEAYIVKSGDPTELKNAIDQVLQAR